MKKSPRLAAATLLTLLLPLSSFALDPSVVRDIRRADDVAELVNIATNLVENASSNFPTDQDKSAQISMDLDLYLSFIKIKIDGVNAAKLDKQHKEILTALSKK